MMLLSRFWYAILSILLGVALYVVFIAVGQYNRRNLAAMNEELASDSQTVGWALQIDARRRIDAMLPASVDSGLRGALVGANNRDKVPAKSREDARRALQGVMAQLQEKLPDFKPDALFAVDRDGRVVGQMGYDAANAFDDFELGGYPAVFDALHGYLRDDTWVWGGKVYRVAARPVEDDATQAPVGAIVGMRQIDSKFAQDLAKRTRANLAFFAGGVKLAAGAYEREGGDRLDDSAFELLNADFPKFADDKAYRDSGRTEVRPLNDGVAAMYARLPGDGWELGAGFAVLRPKVAINGPMGFLNGADDTDKSSVNKVLILGVVLLLSIVGIVLSILEHSLPMAEMVRQAEKLRAGGQDFLQLPKFRAGFRHIAQDLNAGIERIAERGGGSVRKAADLESILGPVPAQPAMSAFSFPMQDGQTGPTGTGPYPAAPGASPNGPPAFRPPATGSSPRALPGQQPGPPPPMRPPLPSRPDLPPTGLNPPPAHAMQGAQQNQNIGLLPTQPNAFHPMAGAMSGHPQQQPAQRPPPANAFPPPPRSAPNAPFAPAATPASGSHSAGAEPSVPRMTESSEEDEATMVGQVPAEVLAAATGEVKHAAGTDEWLGVYDDFIRTKRECGEPTEGLTFEKFSQTLKKNRDALMQRHGCKRVRFAVYVKEGRASLKATPVKE